MGNVFSRLRSKDYLTQYNNSKNNDKSRKNRYKEIFYEKFTDMRKRKISDMSIIRAKRMISRSVSDRFLSSYEIDTNYRKVKKNKSIDNISEFYSISPLSRHSSMRKTKSLDCLEILCNR